MPDVNGLVVIRPSSTAVTGTGSSATINANGSVTFSTCATVSLNGVFTSTYDNYLVVMRRSGITANNNLQIRLRASGTDNSGVNYDTQEVEAAGTNVFWSRASSTYWLGGYTDPNARGGVAITFYGPFLTQPTAFHSTTVNGLQNGNLISDAGTHSQSTSYDGVTFIGDVGYEISGLVTVFGFNQ